MEFRSNRLSNIHNAKINGPLTPTRKITLEIEWGYLIHNNRLFKSQ